ncbi:MAG: hypothetical protein JJLCMIEE_00786 [Acidimicrobiales bacterium]|nr:MAG: hypothetical protein EDR02_02945 [Actinomycetota bacterium]MBV6507731.1 hypothetical protein [Acidimicrobiales bacterium]RIK07655.1 MAG: hypothetical protein DCC48_03960 [Acidobacteriota bacterium]
MSDEVNSYVDMDQYADVDPEKALDPGKFQNLQALLQAEEPEIDDTTWDGMLDFAVDPQAPQVDAVIIPTDAPFQVEPDDDEFVEFGAGDLSGDYEDRVADSTSDDEEDQSGPAETADDSDDDSPFDVETGLDDYDSAGIAGMDSVSAFDGSDDLFNEDEADFSETDVDMDDALDLLQGDLDYHEGLDLDG